jgi:hypothetical protein
VTESEFESSEYSESELLMEFTGESGGEGEGEPPPVAELEGDIEKIEEELEEVIEELEEIEETIKKEKEGKYAPRTFGQKATKAAPLQLIKSGERFAQDWQPTIDDDVTFIGDRAGVGTRLDLVKDSGKMRRLLDGEVIKVGEEWFRLVDPPGQADVYPVIQRPGEEADYNYEPGSLIEVSKDVERGGKMIGGPVVSSFRLIPGSECPMKEQIGRYMNRWRREEDAMRDVNVHPSQDQREGRRRRRALFSVGMGLRSRNGYRLKGTPFRFRLAQPGSLKATIEGDR